MEEALEEQQQEYEEMPEIGLLEQNEEEDADMKEEEDKDYQVITEMQGDTSHVPSV